METYTESSVAVMGKIMSKMGVGSLNRLKDRINEVNLRKGTSGLTWITLNNHMSGTRVLSHGSLHKIANAIKGMRSEQRKELVELSRRLISAARYERAAIRRGGNTLGQELTAEEIQNIKRTRKEDMVKWQESRKGARASSADIEAYNTGTGNTSTAILSEIMTILGVDNLHRLTVTVNQHLRRKISGSAFYTHFNDVNNVISKDCVDKVIAGVAKLNHPQQDKLNALTQKLQTATAVERGVAGRKRVSREEQKAREVYKKAMETWREGRGGIQATPQDIANYLKSSYPSSISILDEIMRALDVVNLNQFTVEINSGVKQGRKLTGSSLYTHLTVASKVMTERNLNILENLIAQKRHPRKKELQRLVALFMDAVAVERSVMRNGKVDAKGRKVLQRRAQDVARWNGEGDIEDYQRSSMAILAEMMDVLKLDRPEQLLKKFNEEVSILNTKRTTQKLHKLSDSLLYKHAYGRAIMSRGSIAKITAVAQHIQHPRRKHLQKLAQELAKATHIERLVMNGRIVVDGLSDSEFRKLEKDVERIAEIRNNDLGSI